MTMDRRDIEVKENKRTEFAKLFEGFSRTYTATPEGRQHVETYEHGREVGRGNFEEIVVTADRGEDITDQVLLKLLPYTDSDSNREQGAWVHIAPAVTGDLRKWFAKGLWTRPDDWPHIAQAILHFVRRCNEKPKLGTQWLTNLPVSGRAFVALDETIRGSHVQKTGKERSVPLRQREEIQERMRS